MEEYDFKTIEAKWQKIWEKNRYGEAEDFSKKPKHYHLIEFPYPSGEGLHVGHCMGYGASDAYCRMKRLQGFEVMFPIGWDAFGLPTENYAIKKKVKPQEITAQAVINFKKQMKTLGYSFDWSREVNTTDPAYYKWTQWIFLQFYKHGIVDNKLVEIDDDDKTTPRLAFQAEMPVNWCPSCKIVLANEEVVAGNCERCGTQTEKRKQKQWMLRITAYADRLIEDLKNVDYLDKIKTQQINWIGRSEGTNIRFEVKSQNAKVKTDIEKLFINVFTTRIDTLFGCTYVVLAPEHPLIENLKLKIKKWDEVQEYIVKAKNKSDLERAELEKEKTGVKLEGIKAINPINNEEVDIYIADYVLASYGTGACMAVPAHDQRDFEFAKKYNLPIKMVICPNYPEPVCPILKNAFTEYAHLVDSGEFTGLISEEAQKKITEKLKEIGAGDFAVNFKLRDWIFSRQHYWGEPIPIVHCEKCGTVPLDEKDLPLELPDVENYEPTDTGESPLAKITEWVNTKCPKCGSDAKRETDTMPNWAGSSWYFLRYCDPHNDKQLAISDKLSYWIPVDLYNGGPEHITLHLLYSRFWHKFLYDLRVVLTIEPYQKRIQHGIILGPDGQKMSKSKGNIINPDEMVSKFGADTLRAYIMFIGPYDQESAWNMNGIMGVHRFLKRVWKNQNLVKDTKDTTELLVKLNQTINGVTEDLETYQINTVISKLMELNNTIEKEKFISKESYKIFLQLLYPACPHIASELWEKAGFDANINDSAWPKPDRNLLMNDKVDIAVQINGKTRQIINIDTNASQAKVEKIALDDAKVKILANKDNIVKTIYVTGRIINFVVK